MRHGQHLFGPVGPIDPRELAFGGARTIPGLTPAIYQPRASGSPGVGQITRPQPWEYNNLLDITNFTVGVERTVIGEGFESPGPGAVPLGYRAVLDGFKPIAVDGFGRAVDILLSGTVVVWRLYVNDRLLRGIEAYGMLPYWNEMAGRTLAEFDAGQRLRVTVQVVSNGMGLLQLGARVRGWWESVNMPPPYRYDAPAKVVPILRR